MKQLTITAIFALVALTSAAQVGQRYYGPEKRPQSVSQPLNGVFWGNARPLGTWERDVQLQDQRQNRTLVLAAVSAAVPAAWPVTGGIFIVDTVITKIQRRRNAHL